MTRAILCILASLAFVGAVAAQTTALTYQGRLKNGGEPAAGLHDFRFRLFDAAQGGSQLGSTQCLNNAAVADGLFTASVDFGQQFGSPDERYLEIQVREDSGLGCGNGAGFVTLTPRQPLTAAPLANHAKSAFALDAKDGVPAEAVFVDDNGKVGIGTTAPTGKLDVVGGPMVVQNIGDQADLIWLASERSWVFRQEGVGAGANLKLQSIGGGGNKHFIIQTDGLMGIGTTQPLAKLDVRGDIRLGSQGQYSPAVGEENLRIVRGAIDGATGAVLVGSGFTCQRTDQATYRITFTPPFAGIPVITATGQRPVDAWLGAMINYWDGGPTPSGVTIITRNQDEWSDSTFNFIAIGPR
jgi:hypothetical protein